MLRSLLILLFLMIGFPCFSEEFRHDLKEWQSESLQHFSYGSANLLLSKPWHALEDFQKATALLDRSDKSSCAISFLITFGQTIAYDALGFREQCKQSIGSLFLVINEYDEEDDQDSEISSETDSFISNEYEDAVEFLHSLAATAPSLDIREFLFSFVDQIAEELLPTFKFAKAPLLGKGDWKFDYDQNDASIMQCKAWWKKFKKWCREIRDFLGIASEGYKKIKEIKDTHDQWNNKKNHPNQNYIDPNFKIK